MTTYRNDQLARLLMRLWYHHDLVNDISTTTSNHRDAAGEVLKSVLDLAELLDINSVPGNEWERLYELREHCRLIETLLLARSTQKDVLTRGCREAIEQYCYLAEFDSIPLAAVIETLCLSPIQENDA